MEGAQRYGVLGRSLAHTYSPQIYQLLAGLDYTCFEREPDEVEAFIHDEAWAGVNVTIPYKRVVFEMVDELTPVAWRAGNVNTVTRAQDGRLVGDNTDYAGFRTLVETLGVEMRGRRALVLGGRGGAGTTCQRVLEDLGMDAVSVSRAGEMTYDDLRRFSDAALVVNATPVGMYPTCPAQPCSLDALIDLAALADIVYNPARTGIMMEAERRGLPAVGGLVMLVAQAAAAVKNYTGEQIGAKRVAWVCDQLARSKRSIALIGMPGAGKTGVGEQLARCCNREHIDIDRMIEARLGCSCAQIIARRGEAAFLEQETAILAEAARRSGLVISCGGGVVERAENYPLLRQNSTIVMLDRDLAQLSGKNRPITARCGVEALADARMALYRGWADEIVTSKASAALTACAVADALQIALAHTAGEIA